MIQSNTSVLNDLHIFIKLKTQPQECVARLTSGINNASRSTQPPPNRGPPTRQQKMPDVETKSNSMKRHSARCAEVHTHARTGTRKHRRTRTQGDACVRTCALMHVGTRAHTQHMLPRVRKHAHVGMHTCTRHTLPRAHTREHTRMHTAHAPVRAHADAHAHTRTHTPHMHIRAHTAAGLPFPQAWPQGRHGSAPRPTSPRGSPREGSFLSLRNQAWTRTPAFHLRTNSELRSHGPPGGRPAPTGRGAGPRPWLGEPLGAGRGPGHRGRTSGRLGHSARGRTAGLREVSGTETGRRGSWLSEMFTTSGN